MVDVYRNSADALSGQIELTINSSEELIPGGSGYLEVTINGVSRRMTFTWEDIPTSSAQDDLVSAENYGEQTVYVPYGETATLTAKYKQNHDFIPVELYTAEGAENYQLNNTDPAVGLILDAPPFANTNGEWSGRIVNEEGYALPDSIRLFTRYEGDYEVEITNDWTTNYTYDPAPETFGSLMRPPAPPASWSSAPTAWNRRALLRESSAARSTKSPTAPTVPLIGTLRRTWTVWRAIWRWERRRTITAMLCMLPALPPLSPA